MKIMTLAAAAVVAAFAMPAAASAAPMQHRTTTVVTTTTTSHSMGQRHRRMYWRNVCTTRWAHHRRVRTCRRVRAWR